MIGDIRFVYFGLKKIAVGYNGQHILEGCLIEDGVELEYSELF